MLSRTNSITRKNDTYLYSNPVTLSKLHRNHRYLATFLYLLKTWYNSRMDEHTLLLGFSFSLMPDGSPGPYNQQLAHNVIRLARNDNSLSIAVQWEIADALSLLEPELLISWTEQRRLTVVTPPAFRKGDINFDTLTTMLADANSVHAKNLASDLQRYGHSISAVNLMLAERQLFKRYATLELINLHRPALGHLFSEARSMPAIDRYPEGLLPFQSHRVNRLIIEAIVADDSIVKRGQYLSTPGVIGTTMAHLSEHRFSRIEVLAHPGHTPRCVLQTTQVLDHSELPIMAINGVLAEQKWAWHAEVAQVWCQSEQNWAAYEARVADLIKHQSGTDRQ